MANRLDAIESPADKARYAMELFGKEAGPKLIQVLDGGAKSLDAYMAKARQLGLVLSDETLAAIRATNDAADLAKLKSDSLAESTSAAAIALREMNTSRWEGALALRDLYLYSVTPLVESMGALAGALVSSPDWDGNTIGRDARAAMRGFESARSPMVAATSGGAPALVPVPDVSKQRRSLDDIYDEYMNEIATSRQAVEEKLAASAAERQAIEKRTSELLAEQSQLLDDMMEASRRAADLADSEADARERTRRSALEQARSEFVGIGENQPDLFISGTAEAQRMAFISKNATRDDANRQEAIQQRANEILQSIDRSTSGLLSRQQAFALVGL